MTISQARTGREEDPSLQNSEKGLTSFNKYKMSDLLNKTRVKREVQIIDKFTGKKLFTVDNKILRVRRCQKRVHAWASALKPVFDNSNNRYQMTMITLTYAPGYDWKPLQVSHLMMKIKYELKDKLVAYAWVAEMQERGAVHYHLILVTRKGTTIPHMDDLGWCPAAL